MRVIKQLLELRLASCDWLVRSSSELIFWQVNWQSSTTNKEKIKKQRLKSARKESLTDTETLQTFDFYKHFELKVWLQSRKVFSCLPLWFSLCLYSLLP